MAYRSISLRLTVLVLFRILRGTGSVRRGHVARLERHSDVRDDPGPWRGAPTGWAICCATRRRDSPAQRARKFQAFADATGGGLIEVFETNGTRALPSPTAAAQAFPVAPRHDASIATDSAEVTFLGQPYRVLAHPFSSGSEPLVLCAAAPLEGNRAVLHAFSAGLLWAIPALLAIAALGGYLLSRRALKPVDQITAATRSISVSNLSERLPVPETRDELQRLSETYNAMLARLESAVNEIKRFTGDASHELRNPVSFVRTTAELGAAQPADRCGQPARFRRDCRGVRKSQPSAERHADAGARRCRQFAPRLRTGRSG